MLRDIGRYELRVDPMITLFMSHFASVLRDLPIPLFSTCFFFISLYLILMHCEPYLDGVPYVRWLHVIKDPFLPFNLDFKFVLNIANENSMQHRYYLVNAYMVGKKLLASYLAICRLCWLNAQMPYVPGTCKATHCKGTPLTVVLLWVKQSGDRELQAAIC